MTETESRIVATLFFVCRHNGEVEKTYGMDRIVRSLRLEGASRVPESNLLLEAGLILNFDQLLWAFSGVALKTLQGQEILQPLSAAFSLYLIILVIPPAPYIG